MHGFSIYVRSMVTCFINPFLGQIMRYKSSSQPNGKEIILENAQGRKDSPPIQHLAAKIRGSVWGAKITKYCTYVGWYLQRFW
jgi:hypothetical protein